MRGKYMGNTMVWRLLTWLMLSSCGFLSGCSMLGMDYFKGEKASWSQVMIAASDDANDNSAVAVDIVLVSDETLLPRLAELSAAKWFSSRADLSNTYPKGLRYSSWEVVPSQHLSVPVSKLEGARVMGGFVYARYSGSGAYRARIDAFDGRLLVRLDRKNFTVRVGE